MKELGAPRRYTELVRAIRETVDPEEIVAGLLEIARDKIRPSNVRVLAYKLLMEHGWGQPARAIAVTVGSNGDQLLEDNFPPGTFRAAILALLQANNGGAGDFGVAGLGHRPLPPGEKPS